MHGVCRYSILSHVATQFLVDWVYLIKSGSSSAAQHTSVIWLTLRSMQWHVHSTKFNCAGDGR